MVRKLIKYGVFAIETDHINEKGEKTKIETSVAELICHELDKDELFFETQIYNSIHKIILEGLSENTLYKSSFFLRMENQEIVKFVSEIESDSYDLSPKWLSKHHIETNTELDRLPLAILSSIYAFKVSKVKKRIFEIEQELEEMLNDDEEKLTNLLSEKISLDKVNKLLSEKLGRIILG